MSLRRAHAWTESEIHYLIFHWSSARDAPQIAYALDRTRGGVMGRAKKLGLAFPRPKRISHDHNYVPRKFRYQPTKSEWTRIATEEAVQAGLDPVALLAGEARPAYARARWRAWKRVKDLSPNYSTAGVGRISGHDHTAVRSGLLLLAGVPRKIVRGTSPSLLP